MALLSVRGIGLDGARPGAPARTEDEVRG